MVRALLRTFTPEREKTGIAFTPEGEEKDIGLADTQIDRATLPLLPELSVEDRAAIASLSRRAIGPVHQANDSLANDSLASLSRRAIGDLSSSIPLIAPLSRRAIGDLHSYIPLIAPLSRRAIGDVNSSIPADISPQAIAALPGRRDTIALHQAASK